MERAHEGGEPERARGVTELQAQHAERVETCPRCGRTRVVLPGTEIVCGCRMRVVGLFDIRVVGIPARALRSRRQVVGLRVLGDGA